jgi:hypothetical protein
VLVVLASRHDPRAEEIVGRWTPDGGALLACEDLSMRGWRYEPHEPRAAVAVVGGRPVPCDAIAGVLTLRPSILAEELVAVVPADRQYVAAEMNAFLVAWLASLRCPMLNRPTATCLSGPHWRPEQWRHTAARLGIPAQPLRRRVPYRPDDGEERAGPECVDVTVVGERRFGTDDETLARWTRRLADVANVDLLTARFSGAGADYAFIGATCWPEQFTPPVMDAMRDYLLDARHSTAGDAG